MGKFQDTLKEQNLSPELVGAVGTAESIFGTVSGASAYYGTAYAIGEKLGLWGGGPSDFDRLSKAIENIVKALNEGFKAVLVGQSLQGQQAKIDGMIIQKAEAQGALSILKTVPPGGQLTAAEKQQLITDTDCQGYLDASYWNLPYYAVLAHTDPWSKTLEPTDGALVPAFAIMLPGYLQAIGIWLTALAAARPNPFRTPQPDGSPASMTMFSRM